MSGYRNKYQQYSVEDFDQYDCLKLSKRFYLVLLFVLRGYLVWVMSVTNLRDQIGVISWLYPETALFYLSLLSGVIGLFVLLIVSLRRPGAPNWVKVSWLHSRKLLIAALLFDLFTSSLGFLYWHIILIEWIIVQVIVVISLIILCYNSHRLTINLTEFPQKMPKKQVRNISSDNNV